MHALGQLCRMPGLNKHESSGALITAQTTPRDPSPASYKCPCGITNIQRVEVVNTAAKAPLWTGPSTGGTAAYALRDNIVRFKASSPAPVRLRVCTARNRAQVQALAVCMRGYVQYACAHVR